jgi:ACS family sodium-dependent inorganic phosphate cotransporter
VTIGLYIIEIIAYLLLGSGDEQSWNKVDEDNKTGPEATPLRVQEKQANYNTNEKDEA